MSNDLQSCKQMQIKCLMNHHKCNFTYSNLVDILGRRIMKYDILKLLPMTILNMK